MRSWVLFRDVLEYLRAGDLLVLNDAKVIPARGAWLELETDKRDIVSVRIDRKRKQPVTVLLKALGIAETRDEILELFGDSECIKRTLEKDYTETREEALVEIYRRLDKEWSLIDRLCRGLGLEATNPSQMIREMRAHFEVPFDVIRQVTMDINPQKEEPKEKTT